ncbi:MAG: hypothetical protein BM557_04020 [Flavobacterium sp. MedPE-SWcel]|uniref:DUF2061 domain-containing protein n=1 Tax=uncultured Flavobacterium sp. TaxID=165435 RepID=UPI00091BCCB1|nr:DUF2061 domain-containing protein [uncultured Flavobacterium sp.]OIQ21428.1 MAG: hypothetical protein BM557_04020 [Flavobacterium sp. MedPE-SWcel]
MRSGSHKRHIAKTITWRLVGTLDTMFLAWIISGNPIVGLQVGFAEVITKMTLYYIHERVWFKVNLSKGGKILESRKRHIAKAVTWRFFGTIDTMILAWFISGNPVVGMKIGLAEVATKMILYYLHERVWYKTNFGLSEREKK